MTLFATETVMSGKQKGRAPAELCSLGQAITWIETSAVVPEHPIQRRITPAWEELYKALTAGMIAASGCVDGGERRCISSGEWSDYRLKLEHATFAGHNFMGTAGTPIITVLSIRSFPAAALKDHGYPSGVRLPSASGQDGEAGYHRVITDVLLSWQQVERQWPSAGSAAPTPNDHSSDLDSKSGPGAKTRGIAQAIDELWPNGVPEGLTAKDRNRAIVDWLFRNECSVPISPERAIQRALKARLSR
jgi:hypothetical protein